MNARVRTERKRASVLACVQSTPAAAEGCNEAPLPDTSTLGGERQEHLAVRNLNRRRRHRKLVGSARSLRDVARRVAAHVVQGRRRVSGKIADDDLRADHGASGAERDPSRGRGLDEKVGLRVSDRPMYTNIG